MQLSPPPQAPRCTEQHPQTSDLGEQGCKPHQHHSPQHSQRVTLPQLPVQTGATPRHSPAHAHLTAATPFTLLEFKMRHQSVLPRRMALGFGFKGKRQEATRETWFKISFTLYLKFYMPPAYMKVAHSEFDSLLEQRARCKHKCQTSAQMEEPEPRSLSVFATRLRRILMALEASEANPQF